MYQLTFASTGCPKSLGKVLKPPISKTTIPNGKLETYLRRKKSEIYFDFDTKFSVTSLCNRNVHVKKNHVYETELSYRVVKYTLKSKFLLKHRFSFKHPMLIIFVLSLSLYEIWNHYKAKIQQI